MPEKKHDVFIAYHGTYDKKGTAKIANDLCEYLTKKGLDVYHFPSMGRAAYKANPIEVCNSKTFVLIINKHLHKNPDGSISLKHHVELYKEIEAFYGLKQLGVGVCDLDATVVCVDFKDEEKGSEQRVHHLFLDRTHFYINSQDVNKFNVIYERVKFRLNERKKGHLNNRKKGRKKENNPNLDQSDTKEIEKVFGHRYWMAKAVGLSKLVSNSKTIKCLGISNSEIMKGIDSETMKHALDHGAEIEILFLDPKSKYTQIREKEEGYGKEHKIKETTEENIELALELKESLPTDEIKEKYSLYTYDLLPRINLIVLDKYAILQYYANSIPGLYNPCFFIKRNENKEFSPLHDFCLDVFKHIKKHKSTTSLERKDNSNITN